MSLWNSVISWTWVTFFVAAANAETLGRTNGLGPTLPPRAAVQAPEGMGFWPTNSPMIPAPIRAASASVFRIVVPAGDYLRVTDILGNHPLPELIRRIKMAPETNELGPAEKEIYIYQIGECIRQNVRDCYILESISYGTAFVTGNGTELRTALHVIKDFARNARARRASGHIPIILLNSRGQVVHGTQNLTATVTATYEGALDTSIYKGKDFGRFNLDQVLIQLNKPIARGLPVAQQPLRDGDAAYIIGAARRTEGRTAFNVPDADGVSIRIGKGTALGARSLMERQNRIGFSSTEATAQAMLREGTAVTADAAPRSSGGPILNARGEVVGVYSSGLPQSGEVFPYRISYGGNSLIQVGRQ